VALSASQHVALVACRVGIELGHRLAGEGAIARRVELGARRADDPRFRAHLPRTEPPEQAGQDLAPGQIARAPEDHEVECLYRNDARNHLMLLPWRDPRAGSRRCHQPWLDFRRQKGQVMREKQMKIG
jgi:hypothetical protein